MRKLSLAISIVLTILLSGYLLYPLSSDKFSISWDDEEIAVKKQYLHSLTKKDIKDKPANIILIIVDDLGKFDNSIYGEGLVNTPHLEKLGQAGVVFDRAYVASPVCSPSRAALLTGRYPQRFGFTYQMHEFYLKNRLQYYGYKYLVDSHPWMPRGMEEGPDNSETVKQGLPPSEITLPEILKAVGYKTALIGKWHLGSHPENTPTNFGIDYQYGFYASHSLYAYEDNEEIESQRINDDFTDPYIWEGQRNGPHAIYRNGREIIEKEYLTDAIVRESKAFMSSCQQGPFFLIASFNAPHTPLQAKKQYIERYHGVQDPIKRTYYAMITHLDDAIGELMNYLQENDLNDNTMVFFLSDNGGANYTFTTDNAPLKGGKITDFEGGLNVPMIWKWPGIIEGGTKFSEPVISMDIFRTILGYLDIALPEKREFDGIDLLPHLAKINSSFPHRNLFWYRGDSKAMRNSQYKLIWNEGFRDTLLFSMEDNNHEIADLHGMHPELIDEMIRQHKKWSGKMPEPLWPPLVNYAFEIDGKTYYFDN